MFGSRELREIGERKGGSGGEGRLGGKRGRVSKTGRGGERGGQEGEKGERGKGEKNQDETGGIREKGGKTKRGGKKDQKGVLAAQDVFSYRSPLLSPLQLLIRNVGTAVRAVPLRKGVQDALAGVSVVLGLLPLRHEE